MSLPTNPIIYDNVSAREWGFGVITLFRRPLPGVVKDAYGDIVECEQILVRDRVSQLVYMVAKAPIERARDDDGTEIPILSRVLPCQDRLDLRIDVIQKFLAHFNLTMEVKT